MTQFSAFLQEIRPQLPAATLMAVLRAARRTVRGFCRETKAYTMDFTEADYTLDADNLVATFTLTAGTEIQSPLVVKCAGADVSFTGARDRHLSPQGRQGCYLVPPDTLRFTTEVQGELTGTLILMPTFDATEMPTDLFERHYEVLCEGILANLFMMHGTAWFNPGLAELHGSLYSHGVELAADEVAGRNVYHSSLTAYGGL
jgi:hypothetical protein